MKTPICLSLLVIVGLLTGCATLTEDAMTPIALSFSDGGAGKVTLTNKRGVWESKVPAIVSVRKSDDGLKYEGTTSDGRRAVGVIPSTMGAEIVASAVFLDFGIVDSITDKHRKYPASYVMPVDPKPVSEAAPQQVTQAPSTEARLADLEKLHKEGVITDEEYAKKRQSILDKL